MLSDSPRIINIFYVCDIFFPKNYVINLIM